MTTLSNPPSHTRTFSVPNMLTYARIAAVPAVVAARRGIVTLADLPPITGRAAAQH